MPPEIDSREEQKETTADVGAEAEHRHPEQREIADEPFPCLGSK